MKIPERQAELDALIAEHFGPQEAETKLGTGGSRHQLTPPLKDEEIVERAEQAANSTKFKTLFYQGDTSDYSHDASRADQALLSIFAFYTQDPNQLDRLFRGSALFRPEKWGKRADYRTRTIETALKGLTETYKASRGSGVTRAEKSGDGEEKDSPEMRRSNDVTKELKKIVYGADGGPAAMRFHYTDYGNAECLVSRHSEDLLFVHAWRRWLEYDGQRFCLDDTGAIGRRAKETVRSMYRDAEKLEVAENRKDLAKHAMNSEARSRIEAMIALAESEPGIPVRAAELDADPCGFST